jgi:hypothetical protein
MPAQLLILAFPGIDILVDCLMAQPGGNTAGKPQPTGNLLRRPAILQAIYHGGTQAGVTQELAVFAPPVDRTFHVQ